MEILYVAILGVCLTRVDCQQVDDDHYTNYVSEPFAITEELLQRDGGFIAICNARINILLAKLSAEEHQRPNTALCTRKDLWDKRNDPYEIEEDDSAINPFDLWMENEALRLE